jgi:hypothetical protein
VFNTTKGGLALEQQRHKQFVDSKQVWWFCPKIISAKFVRCR